MRRFARCAGSLALATILACVAPQLAAAQEPASAEVHPWQKIQVERNGFSKKVQLRDLASGRTMEMKYKGIPIAIGSPINLIFAPDVYEKESHRVVYRFQHPLSARPMVLLARSKSHSMASVPVRSPETAPVVDLFEGEETQSRGTLRYDFESRILFSGQIGERRVEIERVSKDTALNKGLLRYFLFPYPEEGEFVIRLEGREAARFTQKRQHGFKSRYDLALDGGMDEATRNDAMLAFVVFDLMKDFVHSNG